MTDVLVISGPAGVGKSSVAFETSRQLQAKNLKHALIDTDELDRIYPVPPDLPEVTERNLRAVWRTYSERGVQRLILAGVFLDRPSELAWIADAIPGARFTLVRLTASETTLIDRVKRREIGSGFEEQTLRTRQQLAAVTDDPAVHTLSTDGRSVEETAVSIMVLWLSSE